MYQICIKYVSNMYQIKELCFVICKLVVNLNYYIQLMIRKKAIN